MQCFFCENPAAHPATGTQYTERALACRQCAVDILKWVVNHTNKRQRKNSKAVSTTLNASHLTFYEAATKFAGSG